MIFLKVSIRRASSLTLFSSLAVTRFSTWPLTPSRVDSSFVSAKAAPVGRAIARIIDMSKIFFIVLENNRFKESVYLRVG